MLTALLNLSAIYTLNLFLFLCRFTHSFYDTVNDTVNAILALIKQNPSITYEDLTEKTGKSRRTISRIITELKTTGTIARVGSDKTGHWILKL